MFPFLLLVAERVWLFHAPRSLSRAQLRYKRTTIIYCACQVRKMTVDNLGPTASAMNFGKYSAQNDVCSFDYSHWTKKRIYSGLPVEQMCRKFGAPRLLFICTARKCYSNVKVYLYASVV